MDFPTITTEQLKEKLDREDRFTLLDVRSAGLFWQGHIRGAVSIPAERINDFADEHLDQTQPVVVYGQDERDTLPLRASGDLIARGFRGISVLKTGFVGWRAAGYITEGGS